MCALFKAKDAYVSNIFIIYIFYSARVYDTFVKTFISKN